MSVTSRGGVSTIFSQLRFMENHHVAQNESCCVCRIRLFLFLSAGGLQADTSVYNAIRTWWLAKRAPVHGHVWRRKRWQIGWADPLTFPGCRGRGSRNITFIRMGRATVTMRHTLSSLARATNRPRQAGPSGQGRNGVSSWKSGD